ncbi:MAG TPA: DUF899 family protein, partial [Polyangiaceae bacterium]|nr:DUF899 family protein [Polyangiaceae bacterium]
MTDNTVLPQIATHPPVTPRAAVPHIMASHTIASRTEWLARRRELLEQEKEMTRLRDQLSARRRELPWVRVEEQYVFQGPKGA